MNNDTIKAAEEYSTDHTGELDYVTNSAFIGGAEYMQSQKDEQIKELVEGLQKTLRFVKQSREDYDEIQELIQKYKQAR